MSKPFSQEDTYLGIELGSTRIKAALIDLNYQTIASGEFIWKNKYVEGVWTFELEEAWEGIQVAYRKLVEEIKETYGMRLTKVGGMGISGMMHGYLPFDNRGKLLSRFKTWRNSDTDEAAVKLSELFQFNVPHRWSISHLYKAILSDEEHVKEIEYLTTLSSYIHWKVTGKRVIGVGEASGIFPIDNKSVNYDQKMIDEFNQFIRGKGYRWKMRDILPQVLSAGEYAGVLTEEGAKLIDPSGNLQEGIPLAPPEGDAGTGMVATNSIKKHTGNISAGTSIFSMTVLEEKLSNYYKEIDIVTTPTGTPVAMIHCNNFTTNINEWISLFNEVIETAGLKISRDQLFTLLFNKALEADDNNGKLMSFNYFAGEPITNTEEGRPLFLRTPDSKLTLANFMNTEIKSALATLKIGTDILRVNENVSVDFYLGHGGFFKTKSVGQQIMADALETPISVMETASEGGPWGMAVLASYRVNKEENQSLEDYLDNEVFSTVKTTTIQPTEKGISDYKSFLEKYKKALEVEKAAIKYIDF